MNLLKRILMLASVAGPIVMKAVPGPIGIAIGSILSGIGFFATLTHPSPAAVKAFGESAK